MERDEAVIAKYDAVVERIRYHGLKLAINPQYSEYKGTVDSFAQWEVRALELYTELAKRYKPDIFVLVHEPTTMASRIHSPVPILAWMDFIKKLATVVKLCSPASRLGAGGLASERDYVEAFALMPELDFIILDIYGVTELTTYNQMIRFAKLRGKSVYIEETWRPPYYTEPELTPSIASLKNIGNSQLEDIDRKWAAVMTRYAQANNLESITPVWLWPLFAYVDGEGNLDDPVYNNIVITAILAGERTSYFRTVQQLILENKTLRR